MSYANILGALLPVLAEGRAIEHPAGAAPPCFTIAGARATR